MTATSEELSLHEVQVEATKVAAGYHHGKLHLHHLLLALVDQEDSAVSRAMVGAGLTRPAIEEGIAARPTLFWGEAVEYEGPSGPANGIAYGIDAETAVVRAEGIALGMGVARPMARHLLLSCLWDRSGLMRGVLASIRVSRQQLAAQARSAGLEVPSVSLPKDPPRAA